MDTCWFSANQVNPFRSLRISAYLCALCVLSARDANKRRGHRDTQRTQRSQRTQRNLEWLNGLHKRSGVQGIEDFFSLHPTSARHRDAELDIVHRLH